MSTQVLNAFSVAYPTITNRIRASVSLQSSPLAIVASIIDAVAGHPQRTWAFSGLQRENYVFSLDEIDGSDAVVSNLAHFDVVPGEIEGELIRDDEQIKVGTTPGFVTGANSFTFDGTAGKPDYRGWSIVPSELTGRGILVRGLDYSWDKDLGILTMLIGGDVFAADNWWNIHFNPIVQSMGTSYPTLSDFSTRLITANATLVVGDFGNGIIVEPAGNYVEIILPPLATVVAGRPLKVEISGTHLSCTKFIPNGSEVINWLRGNLYGLPGETFSLYKFLRSGVPEWRLYAVDGNFDKVGRIVSEDCNAAHIKNAQILDGSQGDTVQMARFYNEFVLNLPAGQVVNYDDWAIGSNYLKYSLANSANPTNAGKFKFPDRTKMYERNANPGIDSPGDYQAQDTKYLKANGTGDPTWTLLSGVGYTAGPPASFQFRWKEVGTETRPETVLINKFVLL